MFYSAKGRNNEICSDLDKHHLFYNNECSPNDLISNIQKGSRTFNPDWDGIHRAGPYL